MMLKLIHNYLLYEPKIKILKANKIVSITLDLEKQNESGYMLLSSFFIHKDDFEWKILLKSLSDCSAEEIRGLGIITKTSSTDKIIFKGIKGEHEVERQLNYQKCYKFHIDIFNLIDLDIALNRFNTET